MIGRFLDDQRSDEFLIETRRPGGYGRSLISLISCSIHQNLNEFNPLDRPTRPCRPLPGGRPKANGRRHDSMVGLYRFRRTDDPFGSPPSHEDRLSWSTGGRGVRYRLSGRIARGLDSGGDHTPQKTYRHSLTEVDEASEPPLCPLVPLYLGSAGRGDRIRYDGRWPSGTQGLPGDAANSKSWKHAPSSSFFCSC